MARTALLAFCLLGTLLAGCSDEPSGTAGDGTAGDEEAAPLVGDPRPVRSHVLNATGGPDTPLAGFEWTVPPGAIFDDEDSFGEMVPRLPLGVLPEFPEGGNETAAPWAFLAFRLDNEAVRIGGRVERVATLSTTAGGQTEESDSGGVFRASTFLLDATDLAAGDRLGFVVAVTTPSVVPVRVHVKALDGIPTSSQPPTESVSEFTAAGAVARLEPVGTGTGLTYGVYYRVHINAGVVEQLDELQGGDIEVVDAVPLPEPGRSILRDVTISASQPTGGYGEARGSWYASLGASGGTYDVVVDLHGEVVEFRNAMADGPFEFEGTGDPSDEALGRPSFTVVAEGPEGIEFRMQVRYAQAGVLTALNADYWNLGATLTQLLGVPAAPGLTAAIGAAGNVPP